MITRCFHRIVAGDLSTFSGYQKGGSTTITKLITITMKNERGTEL